MKIPNAKNAARILSGMYRDSARVERCVISDDGVICEQNVYDGQRCHLSGKKGLGQSVPAGFKQTEGNGEVKISLLLYFPPCCDIRVGDLITVKKGKKSYHGRAGMPVFGEMALRVPLDGIEVT